MNKLEKVKKLYPYNKEAVENFQKGTSNYDVLNYIYRIEYENIYLLDENTNLKQALNEIRKYIRDRMIIEQAFCLDMKQCDDILQIIDKVGGNEE